MKLLVAACLVLIIAGFLTWSLAGDRPDRADQASDSMFPHPMSISPDATSPQPVSPQEESPPRELSRASEVASSGTEARGQKPRSDEHPEIQDDSFEVLVLGVDLRDATIEVYADWEPCDVETVDDQRLRVRVVDDTEEGYVVSLDGYDSEIGIPEAESTITLDLSDTGVLRVRVLGEDQRVHLYLLTEKSGFVGQARLRVGEEATLRAKSGDYKISISTHVTRLDWCKVLEEPVHLARGRSTRRTLSLPTLYNLEVEVEGGSEEESVRVRSRSSSSGEKWSATGRLSAEGATTFLSVPRGTYALSYSSLDNGCIETMVQIPETLDLLVRPYEKSALRVSRGLGKLSAGDLIVGVAGKTILNTERLIGLMWLEKSPEFLVVRESKLIKVAEDLQVLLATRPKVVEVTPAIQAILEESDL